MSLPLLVPVPPIARSCCSCSFVPTWLFARLPFMWLPFALVCACSVECPFVLIPATWSHLFGLRLAFVCARLCPLACVLLYADPRYLVTLVWPSFVLIRARPLVYVYIKYTISTYMLINTLTFIA